jgi:two-component system NtrC family sensor kinase
VKTEDHTIILFNDFSNLSTQILRIANRGVSKLEFLREVFTLLAHFSNCDAIGLLLKEEGHITQWDALLQSGGEFLFSKNKYKKIRSSIYSALLRGEFEPAEPFFSKAGSFRVGDASRRLAFASKQNRKTVSLTLEPEGYLSFLLIPISLDKKTRGLLEFKSRQKEFFSEEKIELYESLAHALAVAVVDRRAQAALRERVKELTCFYGISQFIKDPSLSIEDVMKRVVKILPPAFQYPELAVAKISFDDRCYTSTAFEKSKFRLSSDIAVGGITRGSVDVFYLKERFEFDEDPFLEEEQKLLDGVAKQIALLVEGKKAEDERRKLQDQLRHADRLATIGELAAGVAHELNEPLGNILGFAQLIKKAAELPELIGLDIEKIVQASLHAREVVKKLLIFARQVPTQKSRINLNKIVNNGLYFLESRCAKEGIEVIRDLCPELPNIVGDPAQLNQVLVNLVVNAIQAMPGGGQLMVRTHVKEGRVVLIVKDTGRGMSEEVKRQIFNPFFTTKEVGEGTGLGLPVVHGIVTSHGGTIQVESMEGQGSQFAIRLPFPEHAKDDAGSTSTEAEAERNSSDGTESP